MTEANNNGWIPGIDIHHNRPDSVIPWDKLSGFVILKATEGAGYKDPACIARARRCRDLGLTVGIYHFYRAGVPTEKQFGNFVDVADAIGLGPGDLLPVLDFESLSQAAPLSPKDSEPGEEWCEAATNTWGGAIIYTSQADWILAGKPVWTLAYPLWIAAWTKSANRLPATPDHRPWRIWQYSVGPFNPGSYVYLPSDPRALDHDWALEPLPTIARPGELVEEPTIEHHPPSYLTEVDWAELNEARDIAQRGGQE